MYVRNYGRIIRYYNFIIVMSVPMYVSVKDTIGAVAYLLNRELTISGYS